MQQADFEQPKVNERVAGEIRAELGRRRITQQELALRLGWAGSQASRRLSGHVPLSFDEVERIARALEVPVEQLMSTRALAS